MLSPSPLRRTLSRLGLPVGIAACLVSGSLVASETPVGTLTVNQTIASTALGYDLQYRVYVPPGYQELDGLPTLYVTDGPWYIRRGELPALLDRLIPAGLVEPLIVVFVDNRDPHDLSNNRRNHEFFCNELYARFFAEELVPEIDARYRTAPERRQRTVLGLSFGGLNSACFGLQAHETFGGIAMQSPAMHPVPEIYGQYRHRPTLPLRIFLSTGSRDDNESASRKLKKILEKKGYELHYVEVDQGHNWDNWKPLLDDVLTFFYRKSPE